MARKQMDAPSPTLPVRYLNENAYIPGVPRCDMTGAQWAELPAHLRTLAVDSGLYAVDTAALDAGDPTPEVDPAFAPASTQGECEECQQ